MTTLTDVLGEDPINPAIAPLDDPPSLFDALIRRSAQKMLQMAIEYEVAEYIERHKELRDDSGHRLVVRNGSLPEREIATGTGKLRVKQPRVNDRRPEQRFTSQILPRYMRRAPSVDALIPALYLRGVSTNDFPEALRAILGPSVSGLSPANIVRLKRSWEDEYAAWTERDLSRKRYVYWWADGIYFKVRLTTDRPCLLILMGCTEEGKKELIAILDGERESTISWRDLLRSLKRRGLKEAPKLAVGDGALGFWAALEEEFPGARHQKCWVHRTANILDKLPKRVQAAAKPRIHDMYQAPTKEAAMKAYEDFLAIYEAKYPNACACLHQNADVLFTFYDFPAEHWRHIRTTNPIESTFATVRHRTRQTKGCGSRKTTLSLVFKLGQAAERRWRRINGFAKIDKVIQGVKFVDGEERTGTQKAA